MELRRLNLKDAPLMLEWMHDKTVVQYLRENFSEKTISDCIRFINQAQNQTESIHLAIINNQDQYMGTVSLKHIQDKTAEFGIVLRRLAIGKGYASFAMKKIIEYGYSIRGINTVYWCVNPKNQRALRFYDKHAYVRYDCPDQAFGYTDEEKGKYIWYRTKIPG